MRLGRGRTARLAVVAAATLSTGLVAVPARPAPAATSCSVAGAVAAWRLHRLAEQVVVVPVQETHVSAVSAQVAGGVGGVILFGSSAPSNLGSRVAALVAKAPGAVQPFVMTDEEGGAVQRMADLVGRIPSARRLGTTRTALQIRHLARRAGDRMRAAGVTMDLAPVLDLDDGPGPSARNPIGTRSFGIRVHRATVDGLAFARGLRRAGVVPVVKHFPGLGQASSNTDVRPATTLPWSWLQTHGLLPFGSAVRAGMPAVMVGNARVPGLTRLPASLARRAIHRELRVRLGFRGLVVTDSLSAGAISAAGFHIPRATVTALRAGADLVLFDASAAQVPDVTARTVRAVVSAVRHGTLSRDRLEGAVVHIVTAKGSPVCG